MRVAIIGAGLAGLTAARLLKDVGQASVIFDKGRGLGGRLSTRRADGGIQFDHGAQYLTAETKEFGAFLNSARQAGAGALWSPHDGREGVVGLPGMSGIAKFLAYGLDVRSQTEVAEIASDDHGWSVAGERFDRVICTVPAPQATVLAAGVPGVSEALAEVAMEPCLTLMLALPKGPVPFETRADPNGDIAWLALDSAKRGGDGPNCWVAQAGAEWSQAHLEMSKDAIAAEMQAMVLPMIGADPAQVLYSAGHRWRYSQASQSLGEPCLSAGDGMYIGGDWALSQKAEGAYLSGRAMAEAVLASR